MRLQKPEEEIKGTTRRWSNGAKRWMLGRRGAEIQPNSVAGAFPITAPSMCLHNSIFIFIYLIGNIPGAPVISILLFKFVVANSLEHQIAKNFNE